MRFGVRSTGTKEEAAQAPALELGVVQGRGQIEILTREHIWTIPGTERER